jgi:Tn3 transposase DDE domain
MFDKVNNHLERAIGALRQQGRHVDEGLHKHVAPVHWTHINLTGDYSWRQNKRIEKGRFPATQDLGRTYRGRNAHC